MSTFARPSLVELIDRITADVSRGVTGIDGAVVRRSLLGILAKSEAAVIHHLYGYLDWIADQVIIDTASAEVLERWASIWGLSRKQATFCIRVAEFSGEDGKIIPVDTIMQQPNGTEYTVTVAGTVASNTVSVTIQALSTGSASNVSNGVSISLESPISGIQSSGLIVSSPDSIDGADTETDDSLLGRLLQRIQAPPQGGAENDYITWALEVPGVTRAWVYPLEDGAGTVAVRIATDGEGIIPSPEKVEEVQEYIDSPYRRPVTADVTVKAPVEQELDITIQLSPNTTEVQAAVMAELDDLIFRDSEPGVAADTKGIIYLSRIREAVSLASGEQNNIVTVPTDDVFPDTGKIIIPGTYTFEDIS